jgi:hypothetical protein
MGTWTKTGRTDMAKNVKHEVEPPNAAPAIEPTDAALAAAAGVNLADLTAGDLAELRAAHDDDAARDESDPADSTRSLVREANGNTSPVAISLYLEACERFGADPRSTATPQEILAWRFYPGGDEPGRVRPDAVVIVTAGGVKLKHYDDPDEPMDADTEDRLRRIFGCFVSDEKTGRVSILPLPADLHLPAVVLNGISASTDHQYVGGYVKGGGAAAAEDKAKRRDARMKRLWFAGPDLN